MPLDIPGYEYIGTYDTDDACTYIGGLAVFLVGDDVTGFGVIDDVLLPLVGGAGTACALESVSEEVVTDLLGACASHGWRWEVYLAKWWNPTPQEAIVYPVCE